jgi:exosortase A-associated hydrolase 2
MSETPLFFASGGADLFGVLHEPEVATDRPAFVFCHPFGEEKLWTHRPFVAFARELATIGYPVLRFDYRGNGDSDGTFEESTLDTMIADAEAAIAHARHVTKRSAISLLGLRFGATIASLVAERQPDVRDLVLWAPIVDGARYMQELLRINLTTQMSSYKKIVHDRAALVAQMEAGATVNVDGYDMALPLYKQCSAVRLAAEPKTLTGRCLAVQIDRTPEAKAAPELSELVARYARGTLVCAQEEPFWKEITRYYGTAASVGAATLDWLRVQ